MSEYASVNLQVHLSMYEHLRLGEHECVFTMVVRLGERLFTMAHTLALRLGECVCVLCVCVCVCVLCVCVCVCVTAPLCCGRSGGGALLVEALLSVFCEKYVVVWGGGVCGV